jgi:hypothetical protein
MSRFVADTETFVTTTLARAVAEENNLEYRVVAVRFRELYRRYRTAYAARRDAGKS